MSGDGWSLTTLKLDGRRGARHRQIEGPRNLPEKKNAPAPKRRGETRSVRWIPQNRKYERIVLIGGRTKIGVEFLRPKRWVGKA